MANGNSYNDQNKLSIILDVCKHAILYLVAITFGKYFTKMSEHDERTFVNFLLISIILGLVYIVIGILDYRKKKRSVEENLRVAHALTEATRIREQEETARHKAAQETIEKLVAEAASRKITVEYEKNNASVDNAYKVSTNAVSRAEQQITIVADYSPSEEALNVPAFRQAYYIAIENKLREKLEEEKRITEIVRRGEKGPPMLAFRYVRFMQRDRLDFDTIKNIEKQNGRFALDEVRFISGDEQAFAHCKRVFDLFKVKNGAVRFDLYITKFVPSLPSILIVDSDKLLFTIPERETGSRTKTAGVIEFTDNKNGKAIVDHFSAIIRSLTDEPEEFTRVSSISDSLKDKNHIYCTFLQDINPRNNS